MSSSSVPRASDDVFPFSQPSSSSTTSLSQEGSISHHPTHQLSKNLRTENDGVRNSAIDAQQQRRDSNPEHAAASRGPATGGGSTVIIPNIILPKPTPKSAFVSQDKQLSKHLHEMKSQHKRGDAPHSDIQHHTEKHVGIGDIIKSIVFGGLDGIITTFAVVAACVGSHQTYATALIVGFSNLIGDGFAMGLGDFFSSRAEAFHARKLFKQYLWRVEKKPVEAQRVMKTVFLKKGFSESESQRIVEYLSHNKEAFADIMLLELDGVCIEESSIWGPLKGGVVTFISFLLFGAVPLIPFAIKRDFSEKSELLDWHFYVSCGLTAASLFFLGTLKNALLNKNWLYGGIFMLVQGGISTLIAYGIGFIIQHFLLPYVE
mmetsp:Transcript_9154/g.33797  ORF Transcript_9154/g.33797 Transcript_9154/m.33797 type:complete len:375 (-) Transcript_9154:63-1187(-)